MPFLYEELEKQRKAGNIKELPLYIQKNLNPNFELRPYQQNAFENFVTYYEDDKLCQKPTQVLFHMATGSGKTLIMAGLILYLYKRGYRNFLFFVNLTNIIEKTKNNFKNKKSNKYLFAEEIVIDGKRIAIQEVENFQFADPNKINICFSTTQGLHRGMTFVEENAMSEDDFAEKVVLISDEAHHLNVDTKRGKLTKEENDSKTSWQYTVKKIFQMNNDNILLEFTATCDLANPAILADYESKIVFNYPLEKYYNDKYSKDILILRSDLNTSERMLQALVLSQYRLKLFQEHRQRVKPVVLFKSATIGENKNSMSLFLKMISTLTGQDLKRLLKKVNNQVITKAFDYFRDKKISPDALAQELKEDFSEVHCVSVNEDNELPQMQILLNSLEDLDNPYRAIFEVKRLDEGWDVLNLFDIVRLYETKGSKGKGISKSTISEAQLIGRGARYFPFQLSDEQPKYQRKYDDDIDNELRVCEELYYHCMIDSSYISELHSALREIGVDIQRVKKCKYELKDTFKKSDFYSNGIMFINKREVKDRSSTKGLLPTILNAVYTFNAATGATHIDHAMDGIIDDSDGGVDVEKVSLTLGQMAERNYALIHKALMKYPIFDFCTLKTYFPNISSTREFITSKNYLRDIKVNISCRDGKLSMQDMYDAAFDVLGKIANVVSRIEDSYCGTIEFYEHKIREVFKDKTINITQPHSGGLGYSQNHDSVDPNWKIDLSAEDWFAYTDNFGTSEEKAFVSYFRDHIHDLKQIYDKVYLVRNEREFHLYTFEDGIRFEPDYVLFLQKKGANSVKQIQIFIEPKGDHLLQKDDWKEDFLKQIKGKSIASKKLMDDKEYVIWGFHFFNQKNRQNEFDADFAGLL